MLQLKLRSHELEAMLGGLGAGPTKALGMAGKSGHGDVIPHQDRGGSGVVGADMMASMAALKQRQQLYMEAVGCE